jgi:predicted RNA binding protein YcfA (HicA-like mRNA interferase family)
MTPLPRINASEFAKLLEILGFKCPRSKGSHFRYHHPDGRVTSLSYHGSEQLPIGTIKKIPHDIDLSEETYLALVKTL